MISILIKLCFDFRFEYFFSLDLINIELILRIIDDEVSGSTLARFLGHTAVKRIEGSDLRLKEAVKLINSGYEVIWLN